MTVRLSDLPSWLRAAVVSGAQTFIATATGLVLATLADVIGWVNGGTVPDLSVLAKGLTSAVLSLLVGVVAAIHRRFRPPENTYR